MNSKENINILPQEELMHKGTANLIKGLINIEVGQAVLTNSRFLYGKQDGALVFLFGNIANHISDTDMTMFIPIENIQKVERGRQGLNSNVLVIHTIEGTIFKFVVKKYKEWEAAFNYVFKTVYEQNQNQNPNQI